MMNVNLSLKELGIMMQALEQLYIKEDNDDVWVLFNRVLDLYDEALRNDHT